jgi:hypothetical protein
MGAVITRGVAETQMSDKAVGESGTGGRGFKHDLSYMKAGPIRCSKCGKVTAQPRYVSFWRVTGFMTSSTLSGHGALLCAACASDEALRNSFHTLLFGWWKRLGPFQSPWAILKNGLGGKHDQASDERLMLHNAHAFLAEGDFKLAHGLARALTRSSDIDIASDARLVLEQCRAKGVDYSAELVDPWEISLRRKLAYCAMAFMVPAMIAAILVLGLWDFNKAGPTGQPAAVSVGTVENGAGLSSKDTAQGALSEITAKPSAK